MVAFKHDVRERRLKKKLFFCSTRGILVTHRVSKIVPCCLLKACSAVPAHTLKYHSISLQDLALFFL